MSETYILGIDIGTTSLSAAVFGRDDKICVESHTVPTEANIVSDKAYEKIQDVPKIFSLVKNTVDSVIDKYPEISSIGFSGQMHGILYIDSETDPVSPLYTWQDMRADAEGIKACDIIKEKTGYSVSAGYGLATHYANILMHEVPENAAYLCTIHDFCAMKLCGLKKPVTHPSDAASIGMFDIANVCFDSSAIESLGISSDFLPTVVSDCIIGEYRGIPIGVPLGDNQASFIGAVPITDGSVLLNIGTGSQISLAVDSFPSVSSADIEIRPFVYGKYLLCGSALCGGRAYAILEKFMRSCGALYSGVDEKRYDALNAEAVKALELGQFPHIRTTFCGKRSEPDMTGLIEGLTENNFTPGGFAAGISYGMTEELYDLYTQINRKAQRIIISGNAGKLNPAVKIAARMLFDTDVTVSRISEEAAYGAALYSASLR